MDPKNPIVYPDLAKSFVRIFLESLLHSMLSARIVDREMIITNDRKINDQLFTLGFNILAKFEDLGGFVFGGQKFFAHALLSSRLSNPSEFFAQVTRRDLHGAVTDELLDLAISNVARDISSNL